MTCPHCGGSAEILAAIAALHAKLDRLLPPPEPAADLPEVAEPPLLRALADAFGRGVPFTSGEAWRRRREEPALAAAFEEAGIRNPHAVGHRLGELEGVGVERGNRVGEGLIWSLAKRPSQNTQNTNALDP